MTNDNGMPEVTAYTTYQWDCDCGEVNICESDPSTEEVECDGCGQMSYCNETR